MSERIYDPRGVNEGTLVPIQIGQDMYCLEKERSKMNDSCLDKWVIHSSKQMGESAVQLINLEPNNNGNSTRVESVFIKVNQSLGYYDQAGYTHDLGQIETILDNFTVREESQELSNSDPHAA
jgi:hypothetical protein